jgi:hypothetical protein
LERKTASQTLEKKTKTVTSSNVSDKVARMILRERKSCQYSSAPERMRAVVAFNPWGIGSTATTILPVVCGGHADRVFLTRDIDHRIVISLRGGEYSRRKWPAQWSFSPFKTRESTREERRDSTRAEPGSSRTSACPYRR